MSPLKKMMLIGAASAITTAPLISRADPFSFNPTGGGASGAVSADVIDQAPGNALLQGINTPQTGGQFGVTPGTNFNFYYQANLSAVRNGNTLAYVNGSNAQHSSFTFTSGFGETVTRADASSNTVQFGLNPNSGTNFFRIYAATTSGNDLTGIGFTTPKLIFDGRVIAEPSGSLNINRSGTPGALDQFLNNDYPGKQTLSSSGATAVDVQVSSFDPNYFPDLTTGSVIRSTFNTSTVVPYNQTDPSACFASATADCVIQPAIGTVNGLSGADFLLQADANQALLSGVSPVTNVPEPGTGSLIGLGALAIGYLGVARRRKNSGMPQQRSLDASFFPGNLGSLANA